MNDRHVIATFQDKAKADRAVSSLMRNGFRDDELSLIVTGDGRGHHFEVTDNQTKTAEGVGYGSVLGGLAAGLAAAAIPGSIFVAGPVAALLASGATGAAAGGLLGGLIGMGISEDEAKLVESDAGEGSIVVAVHSIGPEREKLATELLEDAGATRVH